MKYCKGIYRYEGYNNLLALIHGDDGKCSKCLFKSIDESDDEILCFNFKCGMKYYYTNLSLIIKSYICNYGKETSK